MKTIKLKIKRLANRDMQLARACLTDKQKVDLEIEIRRRTNQLTPKPVSQQVIIPRAEFDQVNIELVDLEKQVKIMIEKSQNLEKLKEENTELELENELLKSQIEYVNQLECSNKTDTFKTIKHEALDAIDQFHGINSSWQEDEATGVHITLNSLQTKNEEALASIEPEASKIAARLNQTKRDNHVMKSRKLKTRKNLDSYDEWVERIQQERFNAEIEAISIQDEIDKLEVTYKEEFERNFSAAERMTAKIDDALKRLHEADILDSELRKETKFREKRATELEMLERALQQQTADYDLEIAKLKKKLKNRKK